MPITFETCNRTSAKVGVMWCEIFEYTKAHNINPTISVMSNRRILFCNAMYK